MIMLNYYKSKSTPLSLADSAVFRRRALYIVQL